MGHVSFASHFDCSGEPGLAGCRPDTGKRHNGSVSVSGGAERGDGGSGRRRVLILGCTGSIGTQALEVIAANPDRFEVVGLAAGGGTRTCSLGSAPPPV